MSIGKVTSEWTADTSKFDVPLKKSTDLSTASGRQIELSAKKAAEAQALAAKLGGDAVTTHTLRIIDARNREKAASVDFAKAQALAKAGYQGEEGGANLTAAALQRLTAAKLRTAEASRVQAEASHKASLTFREHVEGLSIGGGVGESIVGIGAALGAAEIAAKLREMVSASLEFGEAMKRASEKTGLTVETLSILHYASSVTGGDFDKMSTAVAKMDKTIGAATEGNKPAMAFLKSLGLNATELAGRSDGAEIAFKKFASTLAATENPIRRVELATGLLGKAGAEQIPTLIQLGENWDSFKAKAESAGVLLNDKTAAQLEATQQRMKDLQQHILGAGVAFTEGFVPSFDKMLSVISGGKSEMDAMKTWGDDAGKTFAFLAETLYSAAAGLEVVLGASEALVPGLGDIARKDLAAVKPLLAQAQGFHDIAFAKPAPAPARNLGDEDADFLDRNHLGGRNKRTTATAGFEGVGDLSGAADKANQKRLKDMEAELNELKLQGNVTAKWEYEFWSSRIAMFAKGSSEYDTVVAKAANLSVELAKQAHAKILQFQRQQKSLPSDAEGAEIVARFDGHRRQDALKSGQELVQVNADTNQLAILRARNEERQQEAELTDKAGRTITEYAAALELAKVHAAEFRIEMEALESVFNIKARQAQIDPTRENIHARDEAGDALVKRQGERQIEERADNTRINGGDSDGLVGATDALRDFVLATRDSASEMRNLTTNALQGFNAEVVKGISGQRTSFAGFGAGLGRDVAGAALRKGEGSLLDMFGLGGDKTRKPAGTTGDPIHVMVANIQAFQGAPKMPNLMPDLDTPLSSVPFSNFLPGGGGGTMPSVGSLLGTALSLIPGFASGGAIDPNEWAIVGEEGPELIQGGKAGGNVIPNDKLMSAGQYGSGKSGDETGGADKHYHTWNVPVDARGASDAAAINAAVQRGIKAAAPHIAAAGVKATAEQRMRGPSSRR